MDHSAHANVSRSPARLPTDRARVLLEINNAIVSHLDLVQVMKAVSACLQDEIKHDFAALALYNAERHELRLHALDFPNDQGFLNEGQLIPLVGTPASLAFSSRRPVLRHHPDLDEFPADIMKLAYARGIRSGCAVPLLCHDKIVGSMVLASLHESAFTEDDAELLTQIGAQVAIAVDNALNFERTRLAQLQVTHERDRSQLLLEINNAVVSHLDLRELLKSISASLHRIIHHDAAFITLYDSTGTRLRVQAFDLQMTEKGPFEEGIVLSLDSTPEGEAIRSRQPVLILRQAELARFSDFAVRQAAEHGVHSGYYLLRPDKRPDRPIEERRTTGFTGWYARTARSAMEHRWKVFVGSMAFLALGVFFMSQLKTSFMPEDVQYWSYIDVWLPNDNNLDATNQTAQQVEQIVRREAEKFARERAGKDGKPERILKYVTTFVGGGGPRFWFSVSPQLQQLNYAQVIMEVTDKEITPEFVAHLQPIMSASIPGARIDVRQLQYAAIDFPVDILIANNADVSASQSAEDIRTLRRLAGQLEDILLSLPNTAGVRNDWDSESSGVKLKIDSDRANLAGITNQDVAASSTSAMSGAELTTLQDGNKEIPVVARLKMEERAQLSDLQSLYVYAMQGTAKVPLTQVSKIEHSMETERITRLDHFRTIAVRCFPSRGVLSSEVLKAAGPKLKEFEKNLPPGYKIRMGGDYYQQNRGFGELGIVMGASVFLIFLALVFQFNNAVKPFLVFAAAPYGVVGAMAALWIMGTPFGFMAFLGVASLIGVIVSHVIVLFDFIEEKHEEGEPFEEAVIDAGIIRLRPVMITVGATVLALFPLALHGGPLWQPLCYTQIGGLAVATFITLLLVPVLYAIFVLDLKILKWETKERQPLLARAEVAAD